MTSLHATALIFAALAGPAVQPVLTAAELRPFGPGIALIPGERVVFSGRLVRDQGPDDGLEVLAALKGCKLHETLIELDTADHVRAVAAVIIALGETIGTPADSQSGRSPTGRGCRISVRWHRAAGDWSETPANDLVRDRRTDRALAPGPSWWTGGRISRYAFPDGTGGTTQRDLPVISQAGTLVAIFDEEDGAPLALAVPDYADGRRYEVLARTLPAVGSAVEVVITR